MNDQEREILNQQIASLHSEGDVSRYSIDPNNRIEFPRGFLKTLNENREYLPFIGDGNLKTRIANQMLLRDTLHWLWLKTDISANARCMLIKQQLVNLGSIMEAIVVSLSDSAPRSAKRHVYTRLDYLNNQGLISDDICSANKHLWEARKQVHLHLIEEEGIINFTDANYIVWHESVRNLIYELIEHHES